VADTWCCARPRPGTGLLSVTSTGDPASPRGTHVSKRSGMPSAASPPRMRSTPRCRAASGGWPGNSRCTGPGRWWQSAARRESPECAVRSLGVVVLDPGRKSGCPLVVAREHLATGPLGGQCAVQALHFSVLPEAVWPDELLANAVLQARVTQRPPVSPRIVGHQPLDPRDAVGLPPTAIWDLAELLHVHVHQLARPIPLVSDRCLLRRTDDFTTHRVGLAQVRHSVTTQDSRYCPGRNPDLGTKYVRTVAILCACGQDLLFALVARPTVVPG
jgi:hypothetical protein